MELVGRHSRPVESDNSKIGKAKHSLSYFALLLMSHQVPLGFHFLLFSDQFGAADAYGKPLLSALWDSERGSMRLTPRSPAESPSASRLIGAPLIKAPALRSR